MHYAGTAEQGLPKANTRRTWGSKVVHGHTLAMNDFAYSSLLCPPVPKNLMCRRGRHIKFPGTRNCKSVVIPNCGSRGQGGLAGPAAAGVNKAVVPELGAQGHNKREGEMRCINQNSSRPTRVFVYAAREGEPGGGGRARRGRASPARARRANSRQVPWA